MLLSESPLIEEGGGLFLSIFSLKIGGLIARRSVFWGVTVPGLQGTTVFCTGPRHFALELCLQGAGAVAPFH